ncbi:MAG: LysR family transcriptional regulator [Peptococcaceae bacterium]|nr:LysR family transcriptional regulator [Peptococcaceae bacterium]
MRFEQLRCLQEIAKTGSITSAAKNLFISQQAVSASVKHLEEEMGVQLMIRSQTGVAFTEEGKATVVFAQKMLEEQNVFFQDIKYLQKNKLNLDTLQINIGSTSSIVNGVLPKVLADLNLQKQKVSVQISQTDHAEEVMSKIKDGSYDLGLISLNEGRLEQLCQTYDLEYEILLRDEILGVMPRRIANFEKRAIIAKDYEMYPKALCNIEPLPEYVNDLEYMSISTDINFYLQLLNEVDVIVMMPSVSAKQFFKAKPYAILPLEAEPVSLIHVVVYPRTISKELWKIITMIRQMMLEIV